MKKNGSKEITRRYFNNTAEHYDISHDGRFVRGMYGEILERMEQIPAGRILDLGCGNGNVIALLRERRPGAQYYGLDISERMIEQAGKRLGEDVRLCLGDAEQLPYEDASFDAVICNASFHHYTAPDKAVDEMRRVLKPGGSLLLGDPTVPGRVFVAFLNWTMRFCDSGDAKIWHKKEIISLLEMHGFRVEAWKYINHQSFLIHACTNGNTVE